MQPFRQLTPAHRANRRVCKHYKSYKKTLRKDFNERCGYCNDTDANRIRSFVIDHYVPQTPEGWTHSIPPNRYKNLIYACSFCNGAKFNKWPTVNARMHNDGVVGFIKPTLKKYAKIFRRNNDGSIVVYKNHPIGNYIFRELNLDMAIHSLNWRFERILDQEKTLESLLKKIHDPVLRQQLMDLRSYRLEIVDSINTIYNA